MELGAWSQRTFALWDLKCGALSLGWLLVTFTDIWELL